ncbi:uncharacterized protein LOC131550773 [Onychostoma macrolepis]|uniref:uncharacterized protein LOC131550773 n=1 Tax=Onychostoma macrolepis TaxID=369639 RepID=UPI00272A646D|nr:uncharacterized protein LOC131550773 [Onychostoma macrolepis]XP_058649135.1 uncharacterized protein LOC131550773 [Onychostoma macrolepis]XP_058649136.1 uncharacterized protein LOC131550773 [Onychostoma macrolepis]
MSNQEKRHRTSMQHLRYLDSFMDEIDREVMSLTDRAFKSLCIGDEAIYNDSEFSPSLVSCHKPMVEDVSKKAQQSSISAVKKLNSYPLNGANDPLSRSNKSSKDSSLFAAFAAKKNGESSKMTNGDSWDKSALLSIQRELSEFSSDYHSLTAEHLSQAKNHLKSDEKGPAKKSSKASNPPGKSSKSKQSKNNKLRKLNCINFFLHSEFSPFLSWRDFNKFSIGQEHISEIVLSNRSPEWYDSPLYKELTAAHGHYKLSVPPSEVEKCPKQSETHPLQPQLASVQSAAPKVPPKPEKESGHIQHNIPTKAHPLVAEQRCNSERVEACVPWRKSQSRAKSAAPVGHSINSLACERTNAGEGSAQAFKKEVKTIEDQTSTSSTPFSISQLLTPVIPSRHGTGTSEILQTVLSPTALEIPALAERELHPSPEIKREGYKSIASSLLFNLKDNRKRVKAMYSPPKFKGLDAINQSKESPQPEVSKDVLEIPENSEAKTISPAHHKAIISPMSPLLETGDAQSGSPANGGMPDDYLALSLLQSGKLKSNRSPAAIKAKYPSLQLYRKASPEEIRANAQAVVDTSSQVFTEKASKDHDTKHNYPSKLLKGVELRNKNDTLESTLHAKKPTEGLNSERTIENKSGKSQSVSLTKLEEQAISDGTNQIKDRLKTRGTASTQKSPVKEKEPNLKEAGTKHAFSAQQNNYIKSQRFVKTDDDKHHDDSSNAEKQLMDINDKHVNDEWSRHSKNTKAKEIRQEEHNEGICKNKGLVQTTLDRPLLKENVEEVTTAKEQSSITSKNGLESQREQKVKEGAFSVKGNTSAKRALFATTEPVPNKTTAPLKRDNVVIDKYDLAKMALEEVIAEREQRKLKNNARGCEKPQDDLELPTSGEDQLPSMLMLNERGTSAKDGKNQNTVSASKTNWQTVHTKPEDMAKHGESHVPEVKLARPCEQEASNGECQHVEPIKYNERDRLCLDHQESNTSDISKGDKIHQKKELMNKNKSHAMKCTKMGDNLESRGICSVGQYEGELGVDKRGSSNKPEIPPRRGRSNSQSNDRVGEKTEGNLDFKREGDTTGKTEIMESREISKVQSSQSKNRGPVRGNVSALKEKYNKEIKENRKDVQKGLPVEGTCSEKSMEDRPNEKAPKDKINHKFVPPKLTVSDAESGTCSIIYNDMDSESDGMSNSSSKESERGEGHSSKQRKHSITQDFQKALGGLTNNNRNEGMQDKVKTNKKEGADKQNKSKGPKVYVKGFLNGLLGLSSSERVKTVDELEEELSETLSSESFKPDKVRKDSIAVYDILGQSHSVPSSNGKPTHHSSRSSNSSEPSLLHESKQGAQAEELLRKAEVCNMKEKVDEKVKENFQKPSIDSCSLSNRESESDVSDRVVSPPSDVDKRGWVHSLIESARDLAQIPHSYTSSKDQQDNCLNRSEKAEEDLDLFKDHSQVEMPAGSVKSLQPAMQFLSLPATHLVTVKDGKLSVGSASASEEEERCSAVSTLSEGIDGYETIGGDMIEENIFCNAPTEDAEGSKEPSERSASVCSGNDSQGQNKPPVVPPKTEKALRRAMKLTTRRIQKAEAKCKSERKGRSGDKSVAHKAERRHHSTDKVHDRSEHRSLSSDRISNKQSEHLDDTLEHKAQRSEKHARRHSGHKSQNVEENDPSKTVPHATKGKDTDDSKTHRSKKQLEGTSNHGDHLENGQISNDSDRLGRSNEKYLPKKLERRTQSLDRFIKNKHGNLSSSTGKTGVEVHSTEGSQYSAQKGLPLRHNSIEHTYAPATNLVTQSFPITQRKLLQDPDSGEYFLVDMPVQVKTKTFFDPETKSYVQLPVQSPEAAVRQAPPLEVMNTPPLMLYHGYVPVPLPSQKSVVRTGGSMIPPDDLEDFEPIRKQMQENFYKTHNEEVNPYSEPVYISQEHTPEEEIDSVR